MRNIDLSSKKGLIFGVANPRSIAWAIATALADAGAKLAFTYQNDRLRGAVQKTVASLGDPPILECDATEDNQVRAVYEEAAEKLGGIDLVVHSIAFADREDLGGAWLTPQPRPLIPFSSRVRASARVSSFLAKAKRTWRSPMILPAATTSGRIFSCKKL